MLFSERRSTLCGSTEKRRYYSLRGPGIERGREDGEHGTCPKMCYMGVEVGGGRRANTRKGSHMERWRRRRLESSEDYDRARCFG